MKRVFIALVSGILLSACNSTGVKFDNVEINTNSKTLKSVFNDMADDIGETPKNVTTDLGAALWFKYDSNAPSDTLRVSLINKVSPQLSNVCSKKLDVTDNLSAAYQEKNFNPLEYGLSNEELKTLLQTDSSYSYRYRVIGDVNSWGREAKARFETGNRYKEGISGYAKAILNKANKQFTSAEGTFICTDNGKIKEAIVIGHNYYQNAEVSNKEASAHYAVYLDERTLTSFITEQLNDALQEKQNKVAERQNKVAERIAEEKRITALRDEEERIKIAFQIKQRDTLQEINALEMATYWEGKKIALKAAKPGTKVCSYKNNKMGFIEQSSGETFKVLWKGYIENQPDGFFFGNKHISIMSETTLGDMNYRYVPISDTTWVDYDSIGTCQHEM